MTTAPPETAAPPTAATRARGSAWRWAVVPLLAGVAYAPVLGIGFLSDDWVLLATARQSGVDLGVFVPFPGSFLYRPVGGLLTWQLGWLLWGAHPLPYHLLGLLIHAASALFLGLWLATATGRPGWGRLAGALFAVFPLHLEAAGWLAAQWDAWAACFGLASLWLFTRWWTSVQPSALSGQLSGVRDQGLGVRKDVHALHATRNTQHWSLVAAVLCYALGLFSKESLFTWVPLYAGAAWLATPTWPRGSWRRLLAALVPFAAVLALNAGLRIASWGSLGGYPGPPPDVGRLLGDGLLADLRLLLAPLNSTIFGPAVAPIAGGFVVVVGLAALWRYGRATWRPLVVAAGWIGLTLLPVLSLPPSPADLQANRYLYLAAAGYCVAVAVLLYAATHDPAHATARRNIRLFGGVLLLACVVVCWIQIGPWLTATAETEAILRDVDTLVPPQPGGMVWYLTTPPDNYRGAYIFRLGLNVARQFATGELPWVRPSAGALVAPLDQNTGAAFALSFNSSPDAPLPDAPVAYVTGISDDATPLGGPGVALWDFRACSVTELAAWTAAPAACAPGSGVHTDLTAPLTLAGAGPPVPFGARYLRLRVAARVAAGASSTVQWSWQDADSVREAAPGYLLLKVDGAPHVYWTVLPFPAISLTGLRFAPTDDAAAPQVAWIALDAVP